MNEQRRGEITDLDVLDALDDAQLVAGYRAGLHLTADFSVRDPGYWHGYLNGLVDGRHVAEPSPAQHELAARYVDRMR